MSDFFEPPPPPPQPQRAYRPPPWIAPPGSVLGTVVPLHVIVARTDSVVIAVHHATAYPSGAELFLSVRRRGAGRTAVEHMPLAFHHDPGGKLADELLRFGVQFADGRKATSVRGFPRPHDEEPSEPVLTPHGGGGGGSRWEFGFWLYPLPPAGPLAFVCEWPSEGIALTRHEIDSGVILEAASRAKLLWEEPDEAFASSDSTTAEDDDLGQGR